MYAFSETRSYTSWKLTSISEFYTLHSADLEALWELLERTLVAKELIAPPAFRAHYAIHTKLVYTGALRTVFEVYAIPLEERSDCSQTGTI